MLAHLDAVGIWPDAPSQLTGIETAENGQKANIAAEGRLISHDDKRYC